jgi:hypothetical protein
MDLLEICILLLMVVCSTFYIFKANEKQTLPDSTSNDDTDSFELTTSTNETVAEEEEAEETTSEDKEIKEMDDLSSIKKEIELECNFASTEDGVAALRQNSSEITKRLQTGFDMFEERTGKKGMTYSQLREMFG